MKLSKFVLSGLVMLSSWAWAQKPIELIVPFPPGGVSGNLAVVVAEMLNENGRKTIVLNKPGADATIGANYAAKAKPDGQTLFLGAGSSMSANVAFGVPGMEYSDKSFVPVVPLGEVGQVLITQPNSPIKNYEQFKAFVRANPEKFNLGFWNTNYSKILLAWAEAEGLPKPNIIIYKGGAPMLTDVMGGHVQFAVDPWTTSGPLYKGNKIDVIAGFANSVIPEIKKANPKSQAVSIAQNRPELTFSVWYGLYVPAGTPDAVIFDLSQHLNWALRQDKWREKMEQFTLKNYGGGTETLIAWQQRDLKTLRRFVAAGK
jgi:tripartite-type tricarboxylate transporter receptor subunit TctC